MVLIGLVGKKRVGKDTVADYLVKTHGYTKFAFADCLKQTGKELFQLTNEQLINKDKIDEFWGYSPREMFQIVGTQLVRDCLPKYMANIGDDLWIRALARKVSKLPADQKIVISDVRFANEAKWITDNGGYLIKIIRPPDNDDNDDEDEDELTTRMHQSEMEVNLIYCPIVVYNAGAIKGLLQAVNGIVQRYE